jgi:hypothetical protein
VSKVSEIERLKEQLIDRNSGISISELNSAVVKRKALSSIVTQLKKVKASDQKDRFVLINDNVDSLHDPYSYFSETKFKNKNGLSNVLHGMKDITDISHL